MYFEFSFFPSNRHCYFDDVIRTVALVLSVSLSDVFSDSGGLVQVVCCTVLY